MADHPLDGLPASLPSSPLDPHVVLAHRQDAIYRAVTSLTRFVHTRFNTLEANLMATAAELQTALDTLTANVADYTSDVTATLADVKSTLDAALANDATDAATIADLRAQLAAMSTGVDSALTKVQALNEAVTSADVAVDRPSTQPGQPTPDA